MTKHKQSNNLSAMPEVIVCGYERGGTTLVEEILLNTGEFEGCFECGFLMVEKPSDFKECYPYFKQFKNGWNLTLEVTNEICNSRNFNEMYSKLRLNGNITKKLFDKMPKYMENLSNVMQKSKGSKVIVIIRDPRAVIHSWIKRDVLITDKKDIESIKEHTKKYLTYFKGFQEAYKKYGKRIHVIQYEELCINPEKEIKKICEFLNIEFKNSFLELKEIKNKNIYKNSISRDMIYEYRTNMDKKSQREIVKIIPKDFKYYYNDKIKEIKKDKNHLSLIKQKKKSIISKIHNFLIIKIKKPLYVFVHIPKTGGTSFYRSISENFSNDEVIYFYNDIIGPLNWNFHMLVILKQTKNLDRKKILELYLSKLTKKNLKKIKFITGHGLDLDILKKNFKNRDIRLLVLFRHPIKRLISEFNYKTYFKLKGQRNMISQEPNLHKLTEEDFFKWFNKINKNSVNQKKILSNFFGDNKLNDDLLLEKLDKFFFVGFTERLKEEFICFSKISGLNMRYNKSNVSKNKLKSKNFEEFIPQDLDLFINKVKNKKEEDLVFYNNLRKHMNNLRKHMNNLRKHMNNLRKK